MPGFSSVKRLLSFTVNVNSESMQNTMLDAVSLKKLVKMLDRLEMMIGDMDEFIVFLEGYPRIYRQPYITYLILGSR